MHFKTLFKFLFSLAGRRAGGSLPGKPQQCSRTGCSERAGLHRTHPREELPCAGAHSSWTAPAAIELTAGAWSCRSVSPRCLHFPLRTETVSESGGFLFCFLLYVSLRLFTGLCTTDFFSGISYPNASHFVCWESRSRSLCCCFKALVKLPPARGALQCSYCEKTNI